MKNICLIFILFISVLLIALGTAFINYNSNIIVAGLIGLGVLLLFFLLYFLKKYPVNLSHKIRKIIQMICLVALLSIIIFRIVFILIIEPINSFEELIFNLIMIIGYSIICILLYMELKKSKRIKA